MHSELVFSTAGLVLVMVGTPGPNNLMLMASGVNFGVRRSLPHLIGILLGCQILLLAMALGLGKLLALYPQASIILKALSALFLMYVARLLWRAGRLDTGATEKAQPMSAWEAVLFQWINPKAWMICLAMVTAIGGPDQRFEKLFWVALTFGVMSVPLLVLWNAGGQLLKAWLQQGNRLLWFNRAMAVLLLGSIVPIVS